MRHLICLFFCITALHLLVAQDVAVVNPNFGDITSQEWGLSHCTFDKNASAIILLNKGNIYFEGDEARIKIHRRIKILREDALDVAKLSLPFYSYNNQEKIVDFIGYTYNLMTTDILSRIDATDNVSINKQDNRWSNFNVEFSQVYVGSIIEYEYTLVVKNAYQLPTWYFQSAHPTLLSILKFQESPTTNYLVIGKGSIFNAKYPKIKDNQVRWVLTHLPGHHNSPYVFNYNNHLNQLNFFLYAEKIPSIGWQKTMSSWNAVGSVFHTNNTRTIYKKAKNELPKYKIPTGLSQREQTKYLYDQLRKEYSWNGYYGINIYHNNQVRKFIRTKKGKSGELNLWLIGLLKAQGIKANAVLVNTRFQNEIIRGVPLLNTFKHVICEVECEQEVLYLDLTHDEKANVLLSGEGLRITPYSSNWIDLPSPPIQETQLRLQLDLKQQTGHALYSFEGPQTNKIRKILTDNTSPYIALQRQELQYPLATRNLKKHGAPLQISGLFTPVFTRQIHLGEWLSIEHLKFDYPVRYLPIELMSPIQVTSTITILLPEDYKYIAIPKNIEINLPQGAATFSVEFRLTGNQLQLNSEYAINNTFFSLEESQAVVDFQQYIESYLASCIVDIDSK